MGGRLVLGSSLIQLKRAIANINLRIYITKNSKVITASGLILEIRLLLPGIDLAGVIQIVEQEGFLAQNRGN